MQLCMHVYCTCAYTHMLYFSYYLLCMRILYSLIFILRHALMGLFMSAQFMPADALMRYFLFFLDFYKVLRYNQFTEIKGFCKINLKDIDMNNKNNLQDTIDTVGVKAEEENLNYKTLDEFYNSCQEPSKWLTFEQVKFCLKVKDRQGREHISSKNWSTKKVTINGIERIFCWADDIFAYMKSRSIKIPTDDVLWSEAVLTEDNVETDPPKKRNEETGDSNEKSLTDSGHSGNPLASLDGGIAKSLSTMIDSYPTLVKNLNESSVELSKVKSDKSKWQSFFISSIVLFFVTTGLLTYFYFDLQGRYSNLETNAKSLNDNFITVSKDLSDSSAVVRLQDESIKKLETKLSQKESVVLDINQFKKYSEPSLFGAVD